jgi:hypothetical protein
VKRWPLIIFILLGFPAWAQGMKPNQEPVPSPSDLRAERAQDRPDGQAPEDRTPSPSDLSTERPRTDGDRPTSGIQDPRNASAGGTGSQPSPDNVTGAQEPAREPLKKY